MAAGDPVRAAPEEFGGDLSPEERHFYQEMKERPEEEWSRLERRRMRGLVERLSPKIRDEWQNPSRWLIPKLADPDSCCVRSPGTSIAKTYGGSMGYWPRLGADDGAMSQCLPQFGIEPSSTPSPT